MTHLRFTCWMTAALALALWAGHCWSQDVWRAMEDPPEKKPSVLGEKPLEIKLPDSNFEPEPVRSGPFGQFVAVRSGQRGETCLVFDLLTEKQVGECPVEPGFRTLAALSPDGSMYAQVKGLGPKAQVAVYDVAKKELRKELATPNAPEWMEFLGPDKLLTANGWDKQPTLWDLKSGEGKKVAATYDVFHKVAAVSPGGKYLAFVQDKKVALLDLAGGEVAGSVDLPAEPNKLTHSCQGLAFSPDGTRLTALCEHFQKFHLVTWTLKDGATASDVPIELRPNFAYQGPKVVWSPDGEGWLVQGETVVDAQTGKSLWQIGDKELKGLRHLLAVHTAFGLDDSKRPARVLRSVSPGAEKVAAMLKSVRGGGTALDALLPKAVEVDASAAKAVEVPLGGVAWAVKPDAFAADPQAAARPFALQCQAAEVGVLRFPRESAGRMVVGLRPPRDVFDKPTATGPFAVEVYNLITGKRQSRFDLPYAGQLLAVSPDAGRFATADADQGRRVDVWEAEGKHLVGFRPFAKEEEKNQKVAFAALLAADRLLTANDAGLAILWSVPAGKAEYRLESKGLHGWQLSPDGKWLIGFDRDVVRAFDALTGAPAGDLAIPAAALTNEAEVVAISVRPDAKEAVVLVAGPKAFPQPTSLLRCDFATGKVLAEVPLPKAGLFPRVGNAPFTVEAVGEPYFLINGRDLLDAKRQEVVWRYDGVGPTGAHLAAEKPDERTWYVAPGNAPNAPGTLVAAKLPEGDVEYYVKTVTDPEKALLKPGQTVDIQVTLQGTLAEAVKDRTRDALKAALKERGYKPALSDEPQLVLTVNERATGDTLSFRKLFPDLRDGPRASMTVKEYVLDCTAELRVDNKPVWRAPKRTLGMHTLGVIRLPKEDTDLAKYLTERMWDQVPTWAGSALPPRYLARTDEGVMGLPGVSRLQASGPAALKPIVPAPK